MNDWLASLPKAELHLHIDGSLQAQRMLDLAKKNRVDLPYKTLSDVEAAYQFSDLQSFLDLYYLGSSVLQDEEDFYWLMKDYLDKCVEQNITHCELMIELQSYTPRNVAVESVMSGFKQAMRDSEVSGGPSVCLILSILRHLSEDEAMATLNLAEPWREDFIAVGLASSEMGHPPEKFKRFYDEAKQRGYRAVAHAGEEGPPDYIWQAIDALEVDRIDHGVRCIEDKALVKTLINRQIPLTVCPLSNICLCVFPNLSQHNILKLLDQGLCVTVNSDDPGYFGGFLNENFQALAQHLNMSKAQALALAENSFRASFLDETKIQAMIANVKAHGLG